MTITTKQLLDFSRMSQASYLDFTGLSQNDPNALETKLKTGTINADKIFASAQATAFTDPTTGFSFINAKPNDVTGFSATVFKENGSNEYTIAVRGTEPTGLVEIATDLIWADLDGVVFAGMAIPQLISAYRYYKQITTATGQDVLYSAAELDMLGRMEARQLLGEYISNLLPESVNYGIAAISTELLNDKGLGVLIPAGATINFTGHSLGGHVAYLLADMVAQSRGPALIGDVVTYNAPGQNALTYEIPNWFGPNNTNPTGTIGSKHVAVFGEGGIEVTAGLGQVIGTPQNIFIEEEALTANHAITKLSDSLALYTLFAQLNPALNANANGLQTITNVLNAASSVALNSLESALDQLRAVFFGSNALSGGKTPTDNRDQFYTNLFTLQNSAAYTSLAGHVTLTSSAGLSATQARSDFGAFLALNNLSPFVLQGASATLGSANSSLYSQWQADQALSADDRANGKANFSDLYLADRAAMLSWKLSLANSDVPTSENFPYFSFSTSAAYFEDKTLGDKIYLGAPGTDHAHRQQYIFGTNSGDTLDGGNGADHLYGQASNDVLNGGDGNDQLFGGGNYVIGKHKRSIIRLTLYQSEFHPSLHPTANADWRMAA